jgi:hypothetical protein
MEWILFAIGLVCGAFLVEFGWYERRRRIHNKEELENLKKWPLIVCGICQKDIPFGHEHCPSCVPEKQPLPPSAFKRVDIGKLQQGAIAEQITDAIFEDLDGRVGFKEQLEKTDQDAKDDIISMWESICRVIIKENMEGE